MQYQMAASNCARPSVLFITAILAYQTVILFYLENNTTIPNQVLRLKTSIKQGWK